MIFGIQEFLKAICNFLFFIYERQNKNVQKVAEAMYFSDKSHVGTLTQNPLFFQSMIDSNSDLDSDYFVKKSEIFGIQEFFLSNL